MFTKPKKYVFGLINSSLTALKEKKIKTSKY